MGLSLSNWKERTFKKDMMPVHSYLVAMSPPIGNDNAAGEELFLRTESVQLPGTAFFSVDNFSPFGAGKVYNIPYKYNPQEVQMIHVVDANMDLYKIMRSWSQEIIDIDGTEKFGAKYMEPAGDGYVVDVSVGVYNRQQDIPVAQVVFQEAYPLNVEPIQLGWGLNDEIMKIAVTYRFTNYIVE